ncbi:MAG: hypothetical protein ACJ76X_08430 [Solirubrobacteraceae bacterium]
MTLIAALTAPPAGGAPLDQVIGATAAGMLLTAALLIGGLRYRAGRLPLLDLVARPFTWLLGVPAWAALPVALATGALLLAGTGFYWDVAVHIDRGRDPGPFGTPAHYPILIGLFGIFAAGWLALVMARGEEAGRTGVRLTDSWVVPTSGLVMMACGAFALIGFPLDDIWHSIFGQDVTLWGPTHLIMLTGGQLMIPTILALLLEGRQARRGRADASASAPRVLRLRRSLLGPRLLAMLGAGGVLAGLSIYQAEFGFGVPQYNLLFQPALLAFTGALALVFGRAIIGPGGAVAAALVNLAISAGFTIFVGPLAGELTPHFATYLPAALCVEAAALLIRVRSLAAFAAVAGVLIGTAGTIGESLWTHVWMPIAWPAHFLPGAIGIATVAAICGAFVGAFVASSLSPERLPALSRRRWPAGALGAAGLAVVLAFCLPTHPPAAATATVTLDRPAGKSGATQARANATVAFHPGAVVSNPDYVQQLSWQGHTKAVEAMLRRVAPGIYRTVKPLPLTGSWKSLIRFQQGRTRADVPVYLPADPAIPAAGVSAVTKVTRPLIADTRLMQRERKRDVPGWLWSTATLLVLAVIAVLVMIIGWGLTRVARRCTGTPPPPPRSAREPVPLAPLGAAR